MKRTLKYLAIGISASAILAGAAVGVFAGVADGCRALVRELERIELLRRLQANWYYAAETPDVPRCHSLLVDAIKHRKPNAADAAMRLHVQRGLEKELRGYRTKMDM